MTLLACIAQVIIMVWKQTIYLKNKLLENFFNFPVLQVCINYISVVHNILPLAVFLLLSLNFSVSACVETLWVVLAWLVEVC